MLPCNHVADLSVRILATSCTSPESSLPRDAGTPMITRVGKQRLRVGEPGSWGISKAEVPALASSHLSPLSHSLGWAPGPRLADASRSEAFLILEISGRSSTPGAELEWGTLVGWAAYVGHPAWLPL